MLQLILVNNSILFPSDRSWNQSAETSDIIVNTVINSVNIEDKIICCYCDTMSINFSRAYQIVNIPWIIKKAREFQKNIYFCLIDYAKAFDYVDHKKLWKILKEMRIPDHKTCLLSNLYAGQEATVRTGHGTTDWLQIGKGVCKAVYCHAAYLTYMQSTSWETLG